jgi:hypothetical protein
MEEWICQQNIERWNDQLKATDDERRRTILAELSRAHRERTKKAETTKSDARRDRSPNLNVGSKPHSLQLSGAPR